MKGASCRLSVYLQGQSNEVRRGTILKIAIFDTHQFEKPLIEKLNLAFSNELTFFTSALNSETVHAAEGFTCICSHLNDKLDSQVLTQLKKQGVKLIALRSAGFNHVDLKSAAQNGIKVVRVPAYSPYAVAEYAVMLMLALNRKICKASIRVHELNFSLEGLIGFDLNGKTIGLIGTGRIGSVMAKIMKGFGCQILAFDAKPNPDLEVTYTSIDKIFQSSDIITLHIPLSPPTKHLIDKLAISKMKKGVMLINTGRGALIDAKALIDGLKSGQVGSAGLDVYEEEEKIFSQDLSNSILQDDILARLMTFPNVLITAHQAFLTNEALHNIVQTTLQNIQDFEKNIPLKNEVLEI